MPMNPMMRAMLNKVNIPGMPKPEGGKASSTNPVEMRIHRAKAGGNKPKRQPKPKPKSKKT